MTDTTVLAPQPAEYTDGLGETIRASRLYTGLSQRGMAKRLRDMDRRSYQRIENGDDPCPPGLLDTVREVLGQFDAEVDQILEAASKVGGSRVSLFVPTDPRQEWERAVINRAYVLDDDGRIHPIAAR